jgi:hypothetical protein
MIDVTVLTVDPADTATLYAAAGTEGLFKVWTMEPTGANKQLCRILGGRRTFVPWQLISGTSVFFTL